VPGSAWRELAARGDVEAAADVVRAAFRALRSRKVIGKVLVQMGDEDGGRPDGRAKL